MYELGLLPIGMIVLYFEDTEQFDMGINLLHSIRTTKLKEGQGTNLYDLLFWIMKRQFLVSLFFSAYIFLRSRWVIGGSHFCCHADTARFRQRIITLYLDNP